MTLYEVRRNALDQIADDCGVSRSVFNLIGDDHVQFKPDPNEDYSKVDCALRTIQASEVPFKLGFIGNEALIGNSQ